MKGHWRRPLILVLILATMIAVYSIDTSLYSGLVSLSLIVLPTVNWTVFAIILWTSRQAPEIESLRDKVDDQLTLAISSTALAVVGGVVVARLVGIITISIAPIITVGLGYAAVLVSVPAISALRTWRNVYLPAIRRRESPPDVDEQNPGPA